MSRTRAPGRRGYNGLRASTAPSRGPVTGPTAPQQPRQQNETRFFFVTISKRLETMNKDTMKSCRKPKKKKEKQTAMKTSYNIGNRGLLLKQSNASPCTKIYIEATETQPTYLATRTWCEFELQHVHYFIESRYRTKQVYKLPSPPLRHYHNDLNSTGPP